MKRKGCSIIFINHKNQVLLFLRDNNPSIPYPNMWDLPGGHVEDNETPEECIVREMEEEISQKIKGIKPFSVTEFDDRVEHVFWTELDIDTEKIGLTEGQCLKWFSENEVKNTELAYGFNQIVEDFFKKAPFL